MRLKKNELLGYVRQLENVNQLIEKRGRIPDGFALSDCQDLAVKLGNYVENRYTNEATDSLIHALEDYCEFLYQLTLQENQDESGQRKLTKKISKCLSNAGHGIKNDLPTDRKQIVFLPYKASMWDSLESIWLAARDDDSVDAYVIPIPYFDKNPDGSFREMHYEGMDYPDYVPITDWQEYDIAEERPDVIFIHNPYDDANYVTSVEPFFYAKNLKNYTDRLVYIPYFVLDEPDFENEMVLERMEHFVTVPAVIYADQVIVQSEAMKEAYVRIMTKFMEGQGLTRKYWENKILGTGSPKFDKIARLAKNPKAEMEIPEAWRLVIEKADGSRKKVVLYNTSVNAILKHTDVYIRKMRDVFRIFEEKKDDITLLWRPHPLIQATISSMRPQLWKEYQELKEEYLQAGWGIYDDSAELDRAIGISDAYYGDWSSVVQLCQRVKMPVMIQDCCVLW